MLLSSVNFVAKAKIGKSGKAKEEKKEEKKKVEKEAFQICQECKREVLDDNTIFRFPTSSQTSRDSFKTSGYASLESIGVAENKGDRVTIATGDDLCLSVDHFFYTIGLKEESRSDSTCVFRKQLLATEDLPNGHMETVVFVLDCDQEFYLTTSKDKSLELNYFVEEPSVECPDERHFLVYYTSIGQTLIQPKHYKNCYLHHIDASLSVQQLDLNWRCPEEYFFHFNAVPEPVLPKQNIPKICTHHAKELSNNTTNSYKCTRTNNTNTNKDSTEMIPDRSQVQLPKRKTCKNKKFFADLFTGCFSARSHQLTQTEV